MLYRLFPWSPLAGEGEPGGPFFNPRRQQGSGRHDRPDLYGALYLSRSEVSCVAEWLAAFRGQTLVEEDLTRTDGRSWALVGFDDSRVDQLIDLDEPDELSRRSVRPSRVATQRRPVTQQLAAALFAEGAAGFCWWSTLEASWANATLFAERALPRLALAGGPRPLTVDDPAFRGAADALGVRIELPSARTRGRRRLS